jgi:integrase
MRKIESKQEWYLFIDSYPVYQPGVRNALRIREALNRRISTPIWDKTSPIHTLKDGTIVYCRPKRDVNGVILCQSRIDQEACIYADKVRALRQHEFDCSGLYTDKEAEIKEQNEKSKCDFIEYLSNLAQHRRNKDGYIRASWQRTVDLVKQFAPRKYLLFNQINVRLIEEFKEFVLTVPMANYPDRVINANTASKYFAIFKASLRRAFIDGYLPIDYASKVKGISYKTGTREYLTAEELHALVKAPCDKPILKRAALFSALTGLRISDIRSMKWSEIQKTETGYRLCFTQEKTGFGVSLPISKQAYELCGQTKEGDKLVFESLDCIFTRGSLRRWLNAAGIKKHISFHCFRHTFATLQLVGGTDIYTVSKMLGHTNVRTTQIYAHMVDKKKEEATKVINLGIDVKDIPDI